MVTLLTLKTFMSRSSEGSFSPAAMFPMSISSVITLATCLYRGIMLVGSMLFESKLNICFTLIIPK